MSARRCSTFQPFSWLLEDMGRDHAATFAARIKDLAGGLATCLALIEANELERDHCFHQDPPKDGAEPDLPLLNQFDTGNLLRLSVAIAEIMTEKAENYIDGAVDRHERDIAAVRQGDRP